MPCCAYLNGLSVPLRSPAGQNELPREAKKRYAQCPWHGGIHRLCFLACSASPATPHLEGYRYLVQRSRLHPLRARCERGRGGGGRGEEVRPPLVVLSLHLQKDGHLTHFDDVTLFAAPVPRHDERLQRGRGDQVSQRSGERHLLVGPQEKETARAKRCAR